MKAVILAAGIGSRLGELTREKPKCMLPVSKDKTLIHYQIDKLIKYGLGEEDIYIIGGYKLDALRDHLKCMRVKIIENTHYDKWNNIYSFFLINQISEINSDDKFLLLNSDTFFHESILCDLISTPYDNCVVLDTFKDLGEEEMKVLTSNRKVLKFGKEIPVDKATGEYIGLAKFIKSNLEPLFNLIEKLIARGETNLWYEEAFNYITDKVDIRYIDTRKKPWIEIDTVEDYRKAQRIGIS